MSKYIILLAIKKQLRKRNNILDGQDKDDVLYGLREGVWNTFTDEGEMTWRESVHQEFIKADITPKSYLKFICHQKLKDL